MILSSLSAFTYFTFRVNFDSFLSPLVSSFKSPKFFLGIGETITLSGLEEGNFLGLRDSIISENTSARLTFLDGD